MSNDVGRFEPYERVVDHDGWDIDEPPVTRRTEVSEERPRHVVTRNSSPDINFDRSINPYRGCEHGCIYCFARPTHAYLGLSPGLDFETRLIARPDAPSLLRKELSAPSYRVAPIAIGTNTDAYQPIERERKIMRGVLETLQVFRHPVTIVTKGTLIERDIDILGEMGRAGLVRVGMSVTTLDPGLARVMEPRVPAPARRLQTIERLAKAGCPVHVMLAPVIPGLTEHELERILAAAAESGARTANWVMLRLPLEVAPLFEEWLHHNFPDRADRVLARVKEMHGGEMYDARWNHRMRGEGPFAEMIAHRFRIAMRKTGLDQGMPDLRTDLFRVPGRGQQLSLF